MFTAQIRTTAARWSSLQTVTGEGRAGKTVCILLLLQAERGHVWYPIGRKLAVNCASLLTHLFQTRNGIILTINAS